MRLTALAALVVIALIAAAPAAAAGRCGAHPWCDTTLRADQRAQMLLGALTDNEKRSLLAGDDFIGFAGTDPNGHSGTSRGIPRVDLPDVLYTDGPVGVRQGRATAMPAPIGLAATFDPASAALYGRTVASEARAKGNDVLFAPNVNIMRTPLGGRTFEAFGEDTLLASRLAVGYIEGAQSTGVVADVKHFAGNNQEGQAGVPEIGGTLGSRLLVNDNVDERTLREIYLPQFEAAVREAHVGTVMCAYNQVGGQYACENRHLLAQVLKGEWRFPGYVLADYGAAHDPGASLRGGLDFEPWPGLAYSPLAVELALTTGAATTAMVDESVRRILRTMFAYGLFDRPAFRNDDGQIDTAGDAGAAGRVEERAITLLKNRGGLLPLDARRLRSIAVIGPNADRFVTGGGSGAVSPFASVTARAGIAARAGPGVSVRYDDGSDSARAAAAARASQVAVVVVGDYETEGTDRPCMGLNCSNAIEGGRYATLDRDALISTVAAANPNTIVVLETGAPVLTPWRDQVRALVEAWYPGESGGSAIARVLFGDVNPAGRLPATFPRQEADTPTAGDLAKYPGIGEQAYYKEGIFVGYRWYDERRLTPAFPFGFGLSYTRFGYARLRVERPDRARAQRISFVVRNRGARRGEEVAQVYLGRPQRSPVPEPPRRLAGFVRVTLAPGRSRRLSLTIPRRLRQYWSVAAGGWRDLPRCLPVYVGASSRDVRMTTNLCATTAARRHRRSRARRAPRFTG